MNRAIEAALRRIAAAWQWTQRRRVIGPVARFLRKHWIESIAIVGIAALVIGVNPAKLATVFKGVSWQFALLMIPVTIGTYTARGVAWWLCLRRIGEDVSLIRCLGIEFAGQVMVILPMGDLARVEMMHRAEPQGAGYGKLAGTITFQELLFMTIVGLGVLPRVFSQRDVAILVILMVLAHAGIFTILLWGPAYRWAVSMVERVRVLRRFDKPLRNLQPTFVLLFSSWTTLVPVLLLTAVATLLTYVLFYLALHAVGVSQVGFIAATFVLALSYVLAGLSFVPGGLGAFEGLLTVLMATNGVPVASGAAAGLLYRAYNDGLMAAVGASIAVFVRRGEDRPNRRTGRRAPPGAMEAQPAGSSRRRAGKRRRPTRAA